MTMKFHYKCVPFRPFDLITQYVYAYSLHCLPHIVDNHIKMCCLMLCNIFHSPVLCHNISSYLCVVFKPVERTKTFWLTPEIELNVLLMAIMVEMCKSVYPCSIYRLSFVYSRIRIIHTTHTHTRCAMRKRKEKKKVYYRNNPCEKQITDCLFSGVFWQSGQPSFWLDSYNVDSHNSRLTSQLSTHFHRFSIFFLKKIGWSYAFTSYNLSIDDGLKFGGTFFLDWPDEYSTRDAIAIFVWLTTTVIAGQWIFFQTGMWYEWECICVGFCEGIIVHLTKR